jgi:hypothetical protein
MLEHAAAPESEIGMSGSLNLKSANLKHAVVLGATLAICGLSIHSQTGTIISRGQSFNYSACVTVSFTPAPDGSSMSIATIANGCGATIPLLSVGLKWVDSSGVRVNEQTLNPIVNLNAGEKEQIPVSNWTGPDGLPAKIMVREIASAPALSN